MLRGGVFRGSVIRTRTQTKDSCVLVLFLLKMNLRGLCAERIHYISIPVIQKNLKQSLTNGRS